MHAIFLFQLSSCYIWPCSTYRHKIFDHIHVWKWVDFGRFVCVGVNFVKTCQCVASVYVHGT